MEEAIRKINLSIIQAEYYGLDSIIERIEIKTLKDILNRLDRLQKENEELNYKYNKALEDIVVLSKNSIPKEKIEGKLEKLSSLEHKRWTNWQKYVHDLCIKNKDGSLTIPKDRVEHWNYEIETEYKDLPEYLKEYDRQEIRIFLQELLEEEK